MKPTLCPGGNSVTALVIGAGGQVGGALLRALRENGIAALGTYRTSPAPGLVPLDITDAAAIPALLRTHQPDVVYLTAALTAVDYCEDHADEAQQINVEGARHVARTC